MLRYCDNLYSEISGSKYQLANKYNKSINIFAYPYGSVLACNQKSIYYVKRAGYKMAFSSIEGSLNHISKKFRYFLPRIDGDLVVQNIENGINEVII